MKYKLLCSVAAIALAVVLTVPAHAQLTPYSQDFEALDPAAGDALSADGWLVFGNVFVRDTGDYVYGYGAFDAPNGGPGFSAVAGGAGGPAQGAQQLVVYNDYNNGDHWWAWIEANVYREWVVTADDVGKTWIFSFDARRDNINNPGDPNCPFVLPDGAVVECASTAIAFIKTLNPADWSLSRFLTVDTTDLPDVWGSFELPIEIEADLIGHVFQIGFSNTATLWQPSGVLYDNITFAEEPPIPCDPDPATQGYWHRQCLGVPQGEGGIDPGRNGRGPGAPTEPLFVEELMQCTDNRLEDLAIHDSTCSGMDADPANDACERADKQLTALILNACAGRVQKTCEFDLSALGCLSTDLDSLLVEIAGYIGAGSCAQAAVCASAVNEGFGLIGGGESEIVEERPAAPRQVQRKVRAKLGGR